MKEVRVDGEGRLIAAEAIPQGESVRIILSRNAAPTVSVFTETSTAGAGAVDTTTPRPQSAACEASSPALERAKRAWGFVEMLQGGCYGSPEKPVAS